MATKIRLKRTGTTNLALYRIVVADARSPRDGRFIENLGHYDPRKEGKDKVVINEERLLYWLGVGAQMTEAIKPLVKLQGIQLPQKSKKKKNKKDKITTKQPQAEIKAPSAENITTENVEQPISETNAESAEQSVVESPENTNND